MNPKATRFGTLGVGLAVVAAVAVSTRPGPVGDQETPPTSAPTSSPPASNTPPVICPTATRQPENRPQWLRRRLPP
jgi:hypothetical protein